MLKITVGCVLFILALSVSVTVAQKLYTPAEKSAERAAILSALSVPVSKELKQKITFSVEKLNVKGNWAFAEVQPKNSTGGEPNWKITKYQKMIDQDTWSGEAIVALLKKSNGKWHTVTYLINCFDVCYLGWNKKYKAPKAIMEL